MTLSIADIDKWDPESISAVGAASAARADAAAQAGSRLTALSTFSSWKGAGASAAQARTQVLAEGLEQHGQAASTVATAAKTAANEVRQLKSQLGELRSTLGQYGMIIDANASRVVPPTNLSSLSPAYRGLVQDVAKIGQQSLDMIRQAADQSDAFLAGAVKAKGDDFELDTQYMRAQGVVGGPPPESGMDCAQLTIQVTGLTVAATGLTVATHSKLYGCGSDGAHCKQ